MTWHRRFFFLLLVLLPTQLGYHFWPQWAMVLGRRVDYLAPTIYVTDILVGCLLLSWFSQSLKRIKGLVFRIKRKLKKPELSFFPNILYTKSLILFVVFVTLNIFVATDRPVALYKWIKVSEFVLLGLYIVKTKPPLAAIITPLSFGVLYSSVLATRQFILQHSIGGSLWWLGERTFDADTPGIARIVLHWSLGFGYWDFGLKLRPYATFPHPNVLGGFLAVTLPIIVVRLLGRIRGLGDAKKWENFFYGVTMVMGGIALILTFSRSAIVVGVIAIAAAIARIKNYELRIKKNKRLVALVLIGFFVLLLTSYFIIYNSTEESVVVRQQLNAAAIKLWASSPLFGVGLGNLLVRLPETLPSRTIYFLQPVHNIYLLLLSEIGVIGIGTAIFLVAFLFRHTSGTIKHGKNNKIELSIIRNSLFIILILGFVDHYPLTLQQGQLLLTVLAAESLAWIH